MQRHSRIRWNAEERAAVIRRAQTLVAANPKLRQSVLFKESQECLPVERRREPFANAVSWLKLELSKAGPLPSPVTVWRPEASEQPPGNHDDPSAPPSTVVANAQQNSSPAAVRSPPPPASSLEHFIEIGVLFITGILGDPRVKAAVSGLMSHASPAPPPQAATGSAPTPEVEAPAPTSPRGEFVVVAGCSAAEAKSLASEVDGALDVRFWSSDEPRERLLELIPQAEVVIGVANGIPRAIESSLSRLGDRYVRHTGGMKGLYRRLAEHAMR